MVNLTRLFYPTCFLLVATNARNTSKSEGVSCSGGCVCRLPLDCPTAPQPQLLSRLCCAEGLVCCPPTGVSRTLCEVYSRLAATAEDCGLQPLAAPLMVGGDLVDPGQVPHMALLGYRGERAEQWQCGGALLSERWVLTAAHCLQGQRGPLWVRLGLWQWGSPVGEGTQQLEVDTQVPHPRYHPPARYHDIGLLRLAGEGAALGPTVRPACLHAEFSIPEEKAQACGYGISEFGADDAGELLRTAWLPLVPRVECSKRYREELSTASLPQGLTRSLLCAGDLRGGKDACQGDSGGPLQIPSRDVPCSFLLVGVTAFGKFCGLRESPGVYTRVSHYVPWIECLVWPREVQQAQGQGE